MDEGTDGWGDATRRQLAAGRQRRFLFGALLIPPPAAALVGLVVLPGEHRPTSAVDPLILIALVTMSILVVVSVFVLARRRVWWLQASPAWALTWRDRRRIVRSIRAGTSMSGFDAIVAHDTARRLLLQRWVQAAVAALFAVNLVLELLAGSTWRTVWWSVVLVVVAAATPFVWRDARRARRYLDANPGPDQVNSLNR